MEGRQRIWAWGVAIALAGCAARGGEGGFETEQGGPRTSRADDSTPTPILGDGGPAEPEVKSGILRMDCVGEAGLAIDEGDAVRFASAIGLCPPDDAGEDAWGLVSARFTTPDGKGSMNDDSHGVLPNFGPNVAPTDGERLVALSSGTARRPGDPDYSSPSGAYMGVTGKAPPGFPVDFPACDTVGTPDDYAYDGAALEVKVKAPKDARSVRFNVNFYTYEFPTYVCSIFNDFFVVLQDPAPDGAELGNVAFDSMSNPISVNNAYVEACKAQTTKGKKFECPLGTAPLQGTGFEGHAATGWLEVVSPVEPGSTFTLRFAVWDAGDHAWDSTVLIDDVRFDYESVTEPTLIPIL